LLGDSFSWWDLPAYPIGCLLGWFLLQWLLGDASSRITTENG